MSFKEKKVLITGGSRGIGKSIAVEFAKAGAVVGINYHNNDPAANETLELLYGDGHRLLKADISNESEAKRLVDDFLNEFGTVDILVNNAGVSKLHPIDEVNYESWQDSWNAILRTNLIAAANLSFLVSKVMIKKREGRIINVSSRGAYRGEPDQIAYGVSKAGLNSLTQSLAKALGKYNIYVNAAAPGFTETDMGNEFLTDREKQALINDSPLKRMADPKEIAKAILYLASEDSAYTTGAILDLNGASYFR